MEVYTFECSINSDVIVACIDKFCEKITKQTVLVMDNSSVHQNNHLWNKESEWAEKGLEIFFLPTYSPYALAKLYPKGLLYPKGQGYPLGQLNIIEILWRFIKYKWLETKDYESYSTLVEAVEYILINFGTKYTINFA